MQISDISETAWQQWDSFLQGNFGITVTEEMRERFKIYITGLIEWNEKINLISVRSAEEILWRHCADSLAGLKALNADADLNNAIDIGTGAGFPGIPVKIARPSINLTLVESITKKCTFLEDIKQRLSIDGITIINDRAEVLGQVKEHREKYSIVFSRAVAKLSPNLEIAIPFLKTGAYALIYKTEKTLPQGDELAQVEKIIKLLGGKNSGVFTYELPQADKYSIMILRKEAPTPAQYPRRPGVPEKKPLR